MLSPIAVISITPKRSMNWSCCSWLITELLSSESTQEAVREPNRINLA